MDKEIQDFFEKNVKVPKKRGSIKRNTRKKELIGEEKKYWGKIYFDDKFNPLKFTDGILLFAGGKVSSPIMTTKDFDKYSVNLSSDGTTFVSLIPRKMNISYEEYKEQKNSE